LERAIGGGVTGAAGTLFYFYEYSNSLSIIPIAMVLQVLTLMVRLTTSSHSYYKFFFAKFHHQPLRTVMNYQYRYGSTTLVAIHTLYLNGGFPRYYQGLLAALVQGPVSRFGDTAAYEGVQSLLDSNSSTREWPDGVKTLFVSAAAAAFRIFLTPVDTVKTTLQTEGREGLTLLGRRVKRYGIQTLWYGAIATAAATFVGNYPVSNADSSRLSLFFS
jgi:hypothetical protein